NAKSSLHKAHLAPDAGLQAPGASLSFAQGSHDFESLDRGIGWVQSVVATLPFCIDSSCSAKTSAGVLKPRTFRGRLLSAKATASRSWASHRERSVPLGKY